MNESKQCRLLLVDDHKLFASTLAFRLNELPTIEVVGTAADGVEGLEKCSTLDPDLLLVDIKLPKIDGLTLAELILRKFPDKYLIILSAVLNPATVHDVRKVGAHGFVDKTQPFDVLEKAIQSVLNGTRFFSESFIATERTENQDSNSFQKLLSARQQRIVRLVAAGNSNKQIADELDISIRTVESHRYRISQILDLKNPKELFRYAAENGLTSNLS